MEAARGDGKPHSAQDTLPFRQMYPDGLCKLDDKSWSRCIEFEDVNYQLAQPDGQTAIFEALCDMYNAHDASIGMELSLVCRRVNREDFRKRIEIAAQGDRFDGVRALYTDMLRKQLTHGNNGMAKTKFLVLTIEAEDIKTARARFSRIVLDALNHFKAMGALAKELDGKEWLEVLHGVLHPDGDRFCFEWDWLAPSGLHVKDFICPSSFRFGEARRFQMGGKFGAVSFLQLTAPEMNDRLLADLLDTDSTILVSLHIRSMDQNEAIKTVKRKITDLDSMKIDAQKRAAREGFDMDIIPSDLATYAGEAKNILRDLQSRNERMFLLTFLVVNVADTKQKLDNDVFRASSVAQKYNCQLTRLDFQQEQGLVSALPLGVNQIKIQRGLTTSSVSIFVPFISQELFQGGEALYYGLNATSGNMILADRKQLKTPNGLILGTPGSGKSFSAKREILNVFLVTKDDIIICDPEAEYFPLVHRLGGQVIKISPTSSQYVNPMDMSLNYSEDDNPLALKSDFILSFCELAAGGRNGLEPVEKTLIDRAVRTVYRPYLADPTPENVPILGDLYDEIRRQPEPEAQRIAAALELYVHGSLNVFNHRTNVDINNRLVCFDIKELGKQLKNLGMLVIQDQVWNRVTVNRSEGKSTRYYVDEFHLLLRGEVGSWSVEIWKRFRKWGGIPTGITQNIKDLLASAEIENIFENSDFIYLLNQASGDRKILCERLNISNQQAAHISNSGPGQGLIFFGNVILPFMDHFPQDNELYSIMTTKPNEVMKGEPEHE
ncbi:VirB4-like conjugal transfer ATPase, CD1110 family [Ruthenibacterium lactatiformans]|uniref:VirB4-like conjugal transfer ATPase, CD1110 family n=1 Tax=Ruthenibacterium lactatiformans TaxID=1550024 RepID=UPI003AB5A23D